MEARTTSALASGAILSEHRGLIWPQRCPKVQKLLPPIINPVPAIYTISLDIIRPRLMRRRPTLGLRRMIMLNQHQHSLRLL
jgi:hypothetical protein